MIFESLPGTLEVRGKSKTQRARHRGHLKSNIYKYCIFDVVILDINSYVPGVLGKGLVESEAAAGTPV